MHELFLTSSLPGEDLDRAIRILQGYCGMKPVTILRRRLLFEGPRTRTPKGIDQAFISAQPQPKILLWRSLHEQISRQSYIVTLIYETKNDQFGSDAVSGGEIGSSNEGPVIELDQTPGSLRWNDLPDPASSRPVSSRLTVGIDDEKNLPTIMRTINHRFIRELIQETHRFIFGNVIFELNRYLQFPAKEGQPPSVVRKQLPPYESLTPFDTENKWVLTASAMVTDGKDLSQVKKGVDELEAVKSDFEGCFDFQALDRHIFDTRVKF